MSKFLKRKMPNLDNIRVTRQRVVVVLLISLLVFVYLSTRIASLTDPYDQSGDPPIFRNEPQNTNLPLGNEFNISSNIENFPSFNPPPEWGGGFGSELPSVELPSGEVPTGENPFPTGLPTISTPTGNNPTIPTLPTGPEPTLPTLPTGDNPGPITGPGDPINIPERPNKAGNLPNMSDIELIPDFENPLVNIDLNLSIDFIGLIFLFLLAGSLYIHYLILPQLLDGMDEEDEEESSGLFIKPVISAAEIRRKKEREKRLKGFQSHINQIIEECLGLLVENKISELVVHGYHRLDTAFGDFSKLIRTKDITPLEHASNHFSTKEIDYDKLEQIVGVFYRVRFGHKKLERIDAEDFIEALRNLVIIDIMES